MSIVNRPYAGTWAPNKREVVQTVCDFLVYLNGDTSLPGCRQCRRNIDIQKFVTSVSIDCGVEPGASNSSISLAVPRTYGDSIFRDGNTLLRTGLEVHIYFRGYFPVKGMTTSNAPTAVGGINLGDIPQYPYYPVFHGVVTSVGYEYSGGYYSATLTCNGMLHFWQHLKFSTSGSFFGARPTNSGVHTTVTGHPLSGKSPYSIMYSLYRDTAGAAAGVGFALSSRSNYGAVNATTGDSLYALTIRYWEQRFRSRIYGLRMHGATGELFTSSQQAFLSLYGSGSSAQGGHQHIAGHSAATARPSGDPFAQDIPLSSLVDSRVLRQATRLLPSENGSRLSTNAQQLQAFATDYGSYGQVNLFESTYESKLDIATSVTGVTGYEFYQDVDGDLVFKPPLFNLDTSSSRVYRIEPIDIISISFTETEPEATYIIIKGGAFQNTRGLVDESEWGTRSTYVDYKLVAQYGWRESSIESTYYNNAKSAFFFGISQLDRINAGVNACSITIPLRPEIRPGYPVYIPHIDCYYYVQSISHAFNFGGQCTTTLSLTARRRKFIPPGDNSGASVGADLPQVQLDKTNMSPRPLQVLDNSGIPRLIGFPNVVMALDPMHINPMFYSYGFGAESRNLTATTGTNRREVTDARRQTFIGGFIQALLERGVLISPGNEGASTSSARGNTDYRSTGNSTTQSWGVAIGSQFSTFTVNEADLTRALGTFITTRDLTQTSITTLSATVERLERQIQAAELANIGGVQAPATTTPTRPRTGTHPAPATPAATPAAPTPPATPPATTPATAPHPAPRPRAPSHVDVAHLQSELDTARQRLTTLTTNFDSPPSDPSGTQNDILLAYANQFTAVEHILHEVNGNHTAHPSSLSSHATTLQDNDKVVLLSYLIQQLQTRSTGAVQRDMDFDPTGTINLSSNTLELLSDRKASMSVNTPGQYRYYSASHPNPAQQGDADITRPTTSGGTTTTPTSDSPTLSGDQRAEHTQMSPQEAVRYLRQAYIAERGQSPPDAVLAVMSAQWALENGARGQGMYNFNFGGVKAGNRWVGGRVHLGTQEGTTNADGTVTLHDTNAWFRAYGSAEEGSRDYLRNLLHNHGEAIDQVLTTGNIDLYAPQLSRSGYSTGDQGQYARNIHRLATTSLREWIPQSQTTEDTAPTPGTQSSSTHVNPEEDLTTTVVRQASNIEGLPEDRRQDFVEIGTKHRPTKGLRVRTFTNTRIVPTSEIVSLTFGTSQISRPTRGTSTVLAVGHTPQSAIVFINSCLAGTATSLVRALTNNMAAVLGNMTMIRPPSEAIQGAITGIANLNTATGPIDGTPNISNGTPNDVDPSNTGMLTNRHHTMTVLGAKAHALVQEVSQANSEALAQAISALQDLPSRTTQIPATITQLLRPWEDSITALFAGRPLPNSRPFQRSTETRFASVDNATFSPVFPVSDAKGYEHYGSYQYGRGLSIEPGGNYERLMSSDPLRFANPADLEALLRAMRRQDADTEARVLARIAADPQFAEGAQRVLQWAENPTAGATGTRTTQIANGLRNYIMSDRDAVMKLPVNNAAFNLTDLTPMGDPLGGQDSCACRGAEADLLLAAYMSGAENTTFVSVQTPDDAARWVAGQMVQAAPAWAAAQSALRGITTGSGRRSLLDSVSGWQSIASGVQSQADSLASNLTNTTGTNRLNSQAAQVERASNKIGR